jgi:HSP20 family protein
VIAKRRGHLRNWDAPFFFGAPSPIRLAREYELVGFFRQFEVNDKVDQMKITAELKHGVLKLHLPKPEEAKPRKIDVKIS